MEMYSLLRTESTSDNSSDISEISDVCDDDMISEECEECEYISTPVNVTRNSRVSLLINSSQIRENTIINYVIQIFDFLIISRNLILCE